MKNTVIVLIVLFVIIMIVVSMKRKQAAAAAATNNSNATSNSTSDLISMNNIPVVPVQFQEGLTPSYPVFFITQPTTQEVVDMQNYTQGSLTIN
jgi:hypothetical protein